MQWNQNIFTLSIADEKHMTEEHWYTVRCSNPIEMLQKHA